MSCLLTELPRGRKGIVRRITAGRVATQRLADMGITVGTTIKVKESAPFSGPICVFVRGSTLAIGRGLASKIVVAEIS